MARSFNPFPPPDGPLDFGAGRDDAGSRGGEAPAEAGNGPLAAEAWALDTLDGALLPLLRPLIAEAELEEFAELEEGRLSAPSGGASSISTSLSMLI